MTPTQNRFVPNENSQVRSSSSRGVGARCHDRPPPPPLTSRASAQSSTQPAGCPTPTREVSIVGTTFASEHTGGLREDTELSVTISPVLTSDSFVNVVLGTATGSERQAVRGQDIRFPELVRLPAGKTSVDVKFFSTGRDYTADGNAFAPVELQYPTDRGCLPYSIVAGDASILASDTSLPIPGDCDKNVRFEVDRQYFSMKEGESVTYQIYLAGPRPTSFPIDVNWQIKNPADYKLNLLNPDGDENVVFTAEDWMRRNGKEVTLTISDPDNSIDGDGRVLIAHNLITGGGDSNWDSTKCLQTPEALAMTQMRVNVKDVPQTGNQQCSNCATGGDTGALKRPETQQQDGDFVEITKTTLPDASQQIIEQQPQDDPPPARKTETDRDGQPQTQQPTQGLPDPQSGPTPQPEPADRDPEPADRDPDEPTTRQQPQAVTPTDTPRNEEQTEDAGDSATTLADIQEAVARYQNGEITLEELTAIIRKYLST